VKFLLDTDHITILQRQSGPEYAALSMRIALHPPAEVALSVVSFHEQALGGHNYIQRARTAAHVIHGYSMLSQLLVDYTLRPVLPFDAAAGAVFTGLSAQRVRVATMDLRIASIALSRGLTVLTRNLRDFRRVPGLLAEDWTV
jgi:tRNA(fMet)-specific endonuclease VapC